MGDGRRNDIERHLTGDDLDATLREASTPAMIRRPSYVTNLSHGETLGGAAGRVGKSPPTGARWADRWNSGGLDGLAPDHGDGRPPKLADGERAELRELLEADDPWTTREVRDLIIEEFHVTYHQNYIYELVREFGMQYANPRPERPERP